MAGINSTTTTKNYVLGKPTVNHPFIVEIFEQHCSEGNSPLSFPPKIYGGFKAFRYLRTTNPAFRRINDRYKMKVPRSKKFFAPHPL